MIQQQAEVLPFGLGAIEIVSAAGAVVGAGFVTPGDAGHGFMQRWILGPSYVAPPRASVTFRGASNPVATYEEWLAANGEPLWGEGAIYVEARVTDEPFPSGGFRDRVLTRLRRLAGKEQFHFRAALVIERAGDVAGSIFVPEILGGATESVATAKKALKGQVRRRLKEYWLLPKAYVSPPPSGSIQIVSSTRWGGPGEEGPIILDPSVADADTTLADLPVVAHAAYFDSLVAIAGTGARHVVVDCTEFSAIQ